MVPTALLQRRLPDMAAQRYVKYRTYGTYGTYGSVLYNMYAYRTVGMPALALLCPPLAPEFECQRL